MNKTYTSCRVDYEQYLQREHQREIQQRRKGYINDDVYAFEGKEFLMYYLIDYFKSFIDIFPKEPYGLFLF